MRLALVSRSVDVASGGGIGAYVVALARLMASDHEVTVFTHTGNAALIADALADGPPGLRSVLVPEPALEEPTEAATHLHLWSERVLEAVAAAYPDGGPDLIEFPDYLGEGAVTVQARRTGDTRVRNSIVAVRIYTTGEMCGVLNGNVDRTLEWRRMVDLERYALAHADVLIHAGGDLSRTYERFYGATGLAPLRMIRHPIGLAGSDSPPPVDGPLRILCLGRLERRKGVLPLVRAFSGSPIDGWKLTLVGADTPTAPLGTSMRGVLEAMSADDDRITLRPPVPHADVPALIAAHDAVILPSLWECWPNVALEALAGNRPVLATPVGGLTEIVEPGRSGMLARGTSEQDLAELLARAVAGRGDLAGLSRSGALRAKLAELTEPSSIVEGYERLVSPAPAPRPRGPRGADPLVSVIVPYFRLHRFVEEAVESVLDQAYRRIEVIVVNDGSFEAADSVLARMAAWRPVRVAFQVNAGLGTARNFGIALSRGDFVLPMDADNVLEPEFVPRCLEALRGDRTAAFATTWFRHIDEAGTPIEGPSATYRPLGNSAFSLPHGNIAGDATAVIRRSVFEQGHWYNVELTSLEDWFFYRQLARAGLVGHAIPERLFRYRVRAASKLRQIGDRRFDRLAGEMDAHEREESMTWTS